MSFATTGPQASKALFLLLAVASLTPFVTAPVALFAGIALALTIGNPFQGRTAKLTAHLLQLAVIGLGASMDLRVVARVGALGVGYTVAGISLTLIVGMLLARLLRTERNTSLLISVGTAICGGSAIAAVAPVIRARGHQTSIALAVVFLLNAVALILFPRVGHAFGLSEESFGLWSALAIHDTSSVVGAAMQFGPRALQLATTVKLARALWIIPVAFGLGRLGASAGEARAAGARRPWFILGFLAMAALVTWVPALRDGGAVVAAGARHLLVLTLFLVGGAVSRDALREVGVRPVLLGLGLWIVVASATLAAIHGGFIHV